MLVLGRKVGQRIIIGEDIEVLVLDMGGGQVKLGVDAPRDITILRDELLTEGRKEGPHGNRGNRDTEDTWDNRGNR